MNFIEVKLDTCEEASEILMAELAEIGFSTFEEYASGLKGYIEKNHFNKLLVTSVIDKYKDFFKIEVSVQEIEKANWNEEWEKNFNPIELNGICRVRASFHEADPAFKYEIVINPKMTFGTGHHSTTALMLEFQLSQDYQGKDVADIGCGTGILAIMASKLGARTVVGLEVEDWSVENARENVLENQCEGVKILEGKISENDMPYQFDVVLANINKNVLLEELSEYKKILKPKAQLLISGFYEQDIKDLEEKAASFGITKKDQKVKNSWAAVLFENN